jgi:hypothetical protein
MNEASSRPIVYVDRSLIRPGKLAELEAAMDHLAAFVASNVPQIISYGFYLDSDRSLMTVVAVHPDSASLEFHMDVGAAEFAKFADLLELQRIDVYGRVTDAVFVRLHGKAKMLGDATVVVHDRYAGFNRAPRSPSG